MCVVHDFLRPNDRSDGWTDRNVFVPGIYLYKWHLYAVRILGRYIARILWSWSCIQYEGKLRVIPEKCGVCVVVAAVLVILKDFPDNYHYCTPPFCVCVCVCVCVYVCVYVCVCGCGCAYVSFNRMKGDNTVEKGYVGKVCCGRKNNT